MKQSLSLLGKVDPGGVDYRLQRQRLLDGFDRGEISSQEICDAQPELLRNAVRCGTELGDVCPVCEDNETVSITYVLGPRLPPSGRCVTSLAEHERLARRKGEFTGFLVEVCAACGWNHLLSSYLLTKR
ncbi:MAG: DUF5318 family protein [Acidobacteria bacterium]|nr:DUF5318 family protein [Acidobacteriota bacterium]